MSRRTTWLIAAAGVLLLAAGSSAQTPDEQTPAEEVVCEKYMGEGARHGLCVAYCEAQDCEGVKAGMDPSCDRIRQRFIDYSVKQGYAPSPKGLTIDCKSIACTPEDRSQCGGREFNCLNEDSECVKLCTPSFAGLSDAGLPLCEKSLCRPCVGRE